MAAFHPYATGADLSNGGSSSASPDAFDHPSAQGQGQSSDSGIGKWTGPKVAPVKAACLSCRTKKAKCDGQQPVCGQCARKNLECVFVKSRRGGARKRRQVIPPTALSDFLKKLDELIAAPTKDHDSLTPPTDTEGPQEDTTNIVLQFATREEIFEKYYNDIHPFATVMPPRTYLRQILPTLLPSSPFLLAVQTILVLVPHPNDPAPNSTNSKRQRQLAAVALAQQAYSLVESMMASGTANVECVQALTILAMWEWASSGSVVKNRERSGQAVQLAMDLGLHDMDKYSGSSGLAVEGLDWQRDMARRTWWTTYVAQITAAIVSGRAPVVGPDDPRIRCDYPTSSVDDKTWPNFVETVRQCIRVLALVNSVYFPHIVDSPAWASQPKGTTEYSVESKEQMYAVDKQVMDLMKQAEATAIIELVPGGEEEVVRNQQLQARLGLAVVHIHVHRFQAFPEVSLFSKRICGLPQAPDLPSSTPGSGLATPNTTTTDGSAGHPLTSPASSANMTQASGSGPSDISTHAYGVNPSPDYAAQNFGGNYTFNPNAFSDMSACQHTTTQSQAQYGGIDHLNNYGQASGDGTYDGLGYPGDHQQQQLFDHVMDDVWAPETYPDNLPAPWFSYPGGAADLYAPTMQAPSHYPEITASIVPIATPPSASAYARSDGAGRRASAGSSVVSSGKPHKAWGVDEKADKVLPPPDSQALDVFPPGISLARCATAAHTIVRLEVLHRSAVMAMWDGPPKWPPFCSCGLVTGAYAFLLLALAVQADNTFTGYTSSRSEEVEALLTNVKVILAGLEAYGTMWGGIDAMADEVRAALEAATRLPYEVQAQIETGGTPVE